MEALFLKLFNMSITASWLVLAVVILRLLLKKAPKAITVFLWALVGIRLVCPFSFESVLSLIPSAETVPQAVLTGPDFNIDTGISAVDSRVNSYLDDRYFEGVTVPAGNGMTVIGVISAVWLVGIAVMLIYTLISYLKIHRKIREAVPYNENIWVCDRIAAPFILGIFRPKIYLPSAIDKQDAEYVIAHERAHLKRRDHLIKPLGFLLLTVYWFNPVMWIAYILLCRDIELACDEKVIKTMGIEIKKPYSEALINCSLPRRSVAACPLAFGEVGVKSRIKSVLNYKKPAFWVVIVALALCAILPIVFLTNPISATVNNIINEKNYTITSQEKYNITLTVPKSVINESAYTEKGQKFKKNEVTAYKTNTTTIYLEKIMLSNSYENELFLMFNCSYGSIGENNSILLPYTKINNGIESCVGLNSGDSAKDNMSVWLSGPDEQFGFSIFKEEIDNSHEDIKIYAFINKLTYSKKGEETQTEPTNSSVIFDKNETDSSSSQTGNYNPYFNATVLAVSKNSVLVEPFEGSNERKSADKITVNTNVISTHPVPELKNGMQIRIVYNGTIEETYPANIPTAFAIYELREVDGKLEPVIATPLQSETATSLTDSDIKEIYVLSRPSKGQIDKFTVSKTYTDNKLKQLKAFLTTEYCEEKEADNWVKFNPAKPNQTKLALVLSDGGTMLISIHFTEDPPYYIAIAETEESFDPEKDYSQAEYTRYLAKAAFGEFLKSII